MLSLYAYVLTDDRKPVFHFQHVPWWVEVLIGLLLIGIGVFFAWGVKHDKLAIKSWMPTVFMIAGLLVVVLAGYEGRTFE